MATDSNGNRSLPHIVVDQNAVEVNFAERQLQTCMKKRRNVSMKVQHCYKKRTLTPGAKVLYFAKPTALSVIYIPDLCPYYISQVFWLKERIGAGSFGDVFKAISKEDGRMYAIKITNDNHANYEVREVERWEKVGDHRNCVKFYMAWEEQHHLYIQMEYCISSLDVFAMISGTMTEVHVWDILVDVLQGLKHLHDRQYLHMDIKPANIMVSEGGVYKLGDFGLMIECDEYEKTTGDEKVFLISEGDGKYVAMEVLRGGVVSKGGDIFSVGIMLYELITRTQLPLNGGAWEKLRGGVTADEFKGKHISKDLTTLIGQMMNPNHKKRPNVNDILRHRVIQHVLKERRNGNRTNHVTPWKPTLEAYHKTLNRQYYRFGEDSPREYTPEARYQAELKAKRRETPVKGARKLF